MANFYVYAHCLPNGSIFYIGKGSGNRAWSRSGRSIWWRRVVKKYYGNNFPSCNIIYNNLSETDAFDYEHLLIGMYGRRDNSTGILVNMSDGGDGPHGHTHNKKSRNQMSRSKQGIKFSDEHKRNLSHAAIARVKNDIERSNALISVMAKSRRTWNSAILKNKESNECVVVTNALEFSKKYNLHQGHISEVICGSRRSHKKWILITKRR